MKADLDALYEKIRAGDLERADALFLAQQPGPLFAIADALRREEKGEVVTYLVNRNINFTNICVGTCKFCAFREDYERGFLMSVDAVLRKVEEAVNNGATEICIQGGLHPNLVLETYCELIETIKAQFNVHIHAFSPMEVLHAARNSQLSEEEVLKALKRAGLGSMPGTAAEILDDAIRAIICPTKLKTVQWVEIVKTAHRLGIPSTATIMYGHIESWENRVDHLFTIRAIQEETRGFTEFVPLKFMDKNNELGRMVRREVPFLEDAILHALARVILHPYCTNLQVSWVKLGLPAAQRMLEFGVNDMGGTLMEENISRLSGATAGEHLSPDEFERLIRGAGRIPKRRTTLYEIN
jgi:FO synthase subunit 2